MRGQFTLGRKERLRSRKMIERLFKEGKNFSISFFRVYYIMEPAEESGIPVGVGVSTKNFKKAVDRNRIKRLIREAWRLQKSPLDQKTKSSKMLLNVFIIYTGKELPLYKDVFETLSPIMEKLDRILNVKK